ncbi:MAG: hypothetical protein DCC67_00390 [Planctomycetota bacterium]|nr:MAG: hypothetical protein DCC67_00390 [Planctomycetota bacterium]
MASPGSEIQTTAADAASSLGKPPAERAAMFIGLAHTASAILAALPPEERRRRLLIAAQLDPLPDPWWSRFRHEALAVR